MSSISCWRALVCVCVCHVFSSHGREGGNHSLQPLVKPGTGLQEGTLFCVFLLGDAEVAADGKAMLDAAVKIDLVWLLDFLEDDFSLVAFLGWEDLVGFCC
jgi:hypothetical protein